MHQRRSFNHVPRFHIESKTDEGSSSSLFVFVGAGLNGTVSVFLIVYIPFPPMLPTFARLVISVI